MKNAFVHVPKTGGTSIKNNIPYSCNIGHARVSEYMQHSHGHQFLTFIRDPYDCAASGYFFTKRGKVGTDNRFTFDGYHKKLIHSDGVDVNEFLEKCEPNHRYSYFYDKMTPKDFDFVGYTYDMKASVELLNKVLRANIPYRELNVNPQKKISMGYDLKYPRHAFEERHAKDYALYNEGVQRFLDLCKIYDVSTSIS